LHGKNGKIALKWAKFPPKLRACITVVVYICKKNPDPVKFGQDFFYHQNLPSAIAVTVS